MKNRKYFFDWRLWLITAILLLSATPVLAQSGAPADNRFILVNCAITATKTNTNTLTLTIGQPMVTNLGFSTTGSSELGFWAQLKMQPISPLIFATDGAYPDKVVVSWEEDALSPSAQNGFKIFREGSLLATVGYNVTEYQDFNVMAGKFYQYKVLSINQYGEGPTGDDIGFVNPNGTVTGQVKTQNGRAVPGSNVSLTPLVGNALQFDGVNDYVDSPALIQFGKADFTIEAWIKTTATVAQGILTKNDADTTWEAGEKSFYLTNGGVPQFVGFGNNFIKGTTAVNDGAWHHLAVVWDYSSGTSGTGKIYVDGQNNTNTGTTNYAATNNDVSGHTIKVGGKNGGTEAPNYFSGSIDEIRLWNTARTIDEIQTYMSRSLSGSEVGLAANYPFNEGLSSIAFDLTANSYDAKIVGPAWTSDKAPVYYVGTTDDDGNYQINGINYGSGTTFTATPSQVTPINSYSLSLDGTDDYVVIAHDDRLEPESFTIELWAKTNITNKLMTVLDKRKNNSGVLQGYTIQLGNTGQIRGGLGNGASWNLLSGSTWAANVWHHVALVYDVTAAQLMFYEDGQLKNQTTVTDPLYDSTRNLELGATLKDGPVAEAFSGNLDEIRIWKIARSQDDIQLTMSNILNGDEAGLVAYYPCNEGSGDIVSDISNDGDSGTPSITGALMNVDTGTVWSTNSANPETVEHEFSPQTRVVTLTPSNTAVNNVDFTDLTQIPVSGFVRFEGTLCFEENVEILVDGSSYNPKIFTDENGSFVAEFEPGTSHRLTPVLAGHTFNPAFWDVTNLVAPKAGLVFRDQTLRTLTVKVYGGTPLCNIPLIPSSGNLSITVGTNPSCYEITQNLTSGTSKTFTNLPAYNFVVTVAHPDGNITFDGQQVDLTTGNDTLSFEYHAPIQVAITGLSTPGGGCTNFTGPSGEALTAAPILEQAGQYALNFSIFENYTPYGGNCAVDTGYVIVSNSVADKPDTTIYFGNGTVTNYHFTVGDPNLLSGGDHPYQKSLQVTGYELVQSAEDSSWTSGRSGSDIEWLYVQGDRLRGDNFVTMKTHDMPMFVLRDPPGDKSYSYLLRNNATSTTKRFLFDWTEEFGYEGTSYRGPDVSIVVPLVGNLLETDMDLNMDASLAFTVKRSSRHEVTIGMSATEHFRTSDNETNSIGGKNLGDVFVGLGFNLKVSETDQLRWNENTCTLSKGSGFSITDLNIAGGYIYSEHHILNTLLPHLQELYCATTPDSCGLTAPADTALLGQLTDAQIDILSEMRNWIDLLKYNADSLKTYKDEDLAGHLINGNLSSVSFDGGSGGYNYEVTNTRHELLETETIATLTSNNGIQTGMKFVGLGGSDKIWFKDITTYSLPANFGTGGDGGEAQLYALQALLTLRTALYIYTQPFQYYALISDPHYGGVWGTVALISAGWAVATSAYGNGIGWWLAPSFRTGTGETSEFTTKGFHLEDNDLGDAFWVNVYDDGVFGTYFKLVAGQSSCPWEAGTAKREDPALSVSPAIQTEVLPDEPAVFILNYGNTSETDEDRWYQARVLQTSNPGGAEVRLNGEWISSGMPLFLPAGQNTPGVLSVYRGPDAYEHENIKIVLESLCEFNLAQQGLNNGSPFIADTITVSAFYKRPCTEVQITNPGDGWIVEEANNDTLWLTVQGYELNGLFNDIKLQYRPLNALAGGRAAISNEELGIKNLNSTSFPNSVWERNWAGNSVSALELSSENAIDGKQSLPDTGVPKPEFGNEDARNDISPRNVISIDGDDPSPQADTWINFRTITYAELQAQFNTYGVTYIILPWDVKNLDDAAYEIRAVTTCTSAANIAGTSAALNGLLERHAPAIHGNPQPADGVLTIGEEISVTFNEQINCARLIEAMSDTLANIGIYITDMGFPGGLLGIDYTCYENKIIFEPAPGFDTWYIENRTLRASIAGVRDLYDNPMDERADWEFWVNRNPLAWSGGDVTASKYEDETVTITRQIVNNGSSPMSFDFIDLTPNPGRAAIQPADWLTVSPTSGTVNPGTAKTITLTFDTGMTGGQYADTLIARTTLGDEAILVDFSNICYAPAWSVAPNLFEYSMTVTARLASYTSVSDYVTVAAFVGNEVRGVSRIEYVPAVNDTLIFMTVYSDLQSGENVSIRVWDGLVCSNMGQMENAFPFQAQQNLGNGNSPFIVNFSSQVTAEIALTNGWNWFSFNLGLTDMSTNHILSGIAGVTGDLVKSQTQFSQYVSGSGWIGSLTALNASSMYMIKLTNPANFDLIGYPVNLSTNRMALTSGWNWISYQPTASQLINTALSSLSDRAVTGDLIKSQSRFSQYLSGAGWIGNLQYLTPGTGYMLKMTNADTLIYPDPPAAMAVPTATASEIGNSQSAPANWQFDPAQFEHNMTVTGTISPFEGDDVAIGAFVGDECRGMTKPVYIESLQKSVVFMMIYSNQPTGETVEFRLLKDSEETEYAVDETVNFQSNASLGNIEAPFVWTTSPLGVEYPGVAVPIHFALAQNRPNPFSARTTIQYALPTTAHVEIAIYNVAGQKVRTLVNERQAAGYRSVNWDGANDAGERVQSGVYFYRLKTDAGFEATRKLLLIK